MRSDGTHVRRLVPCAFGVQSPDWSADGRHVVFVSSKDGDPGLYAVQADGGERSGRIGRHIAGDPAWSPDGKMLAFVAGKSLFVAKADGTGARRITGALVEIYGPHWSPDSERIVYYAGGAVENLDLFVVAVASRRVTRLTRRKGDDVEPTWSPDGRTIAYVQRPPAAPMGALVVIRADGSGRRTLLREPRYSSPAWSPNGTRIAIVRGFESAAEIYTTARNGSDLRRVTRNRYADDAPDWRPPPTPD